MLTALTLALTATELFNLGLGTTLTVYGIYRTGKKTRP